MAIRTLITSQCCWKCFVVAVGLGFRNYHVLLECVLLTLLPYWSCFRLTCEGASFAVLVGDDQCSQTDWHPHWFTLIRVLRKRFASMCNRFRPYGLLLTGQWCIKEPEFCDLWMSLWERFCTARIFLLLYVCIAVLLVSSAYVASAYQSECYTLDRGGYLYDFVSSFWSQIFSEPWLGKPLLNVLPSSYSNGF